VTAPFPDRRWGTAADSPVRRAILKVLSTRPGSWMLRKSAPFDRQVMARSKGKYTALGPFGLPTMLLTSIGARTGQRRVSPLAYHREDPDLFIVGSNYGQAHHPAWTTNLLANPRTWVNIDGREIEATATPVKGAERDRIYREFESLVSVYTVYKGRTSRTMRIFRLTAS
jgi:deazaflavin-dependent oxidoreductase (nitroreductase family)